MKRKQLFWAVFLFFIGASVVLVNITKISSYGNLLPKQKRCIDGFVKQLDVGPGEIAPQDRRKSLKLIEKVRARIFQTIELKYYGDKFKHDNEPCAVIEQGWGLCFNVSRLFELTMQSMGYRTRHVFLCTSLIRRGGSHAVSEVLIDGRWVGVDTYFKDVKFYDGDKMYGVKEALKDRKLPGLNKNYGKSYYVVYGLYSRTGRLYSTRIIWADINFKEFLCNFIPCSGQRGAPRENHDER